jgi:hypothetical protein
MKTIKELRSEGRISTRTYNLLCRKVRWIVDTMTIKDLFELYSEEEMYRWTNFGPKTMEELKGLL